MVRSVIAYAMKMTESLYVKATLAQPNSEAASASVSTARDFVPVASGTVVMCDSRSTRTRLHVRRLDA